ncbi:MAG: hypothetical protein AYL28_000520 [Candidatus Bathyarchaeota archaeon B23]|nr:MAG: hypothetical protein AYL28_000520 [Candidatus Bathyarchaeota archaeon B23]
METLRAYVEVCKPRVASLLVFSGLASGVIALRMGLGVEPPLGFTPQVSLMLSTLALILVVSGANAITCYIDQDIDAMMERTRRRPIPSGRIDPPVKALYYGAALSILGLIPLLALSLPAFLWALFGLVDSVVVYNLLTKRRTVWNIVLGSPAGGAPSMVCWSAVTGQPFHPVPFLLAALIVLWTPSHIWSLAIRYADDYRRAVVPMLPVRVGFRSATRCIASTTLLLPVLSTILGVVGRFHIGFYILVHSLNLIIILLSLNLLFRPSHGNAYKLFKFTSPYLALLLVSAAFSAH